MLKASTIELWKMRIIISKYIWQKWIRRVALAGAWGQHWSRWHSMVPSHTPPSRIPSNSKCTFKELMQLISFKWEIQSEEILIWQNFLLVYLYSEIWCASCAHINLLSSNGEDQIKIHTSFCAEHIKDRKISQAESCISLMPVSNAFWCKDAQLFIAPLSEIQPAGMYLGNVSVAKQIIKWCF